MDDRDDEPKDEPSKSAEDKTNNQGDDHRETEFPDDCDDLNMNEIEQLDEILGGSGSGKGKLLDYERQMFLDCVYNDGLVICGK